MSARLPVALSAGLAILVAVVLAGCAPTVDLHPAPPHANDPHCADVMVQLDDTLDNGKGGVLVHRETNAQSTAAWGDPTSVILSCGVTVPGPSALPCIQVDGSVYWLRAKDTAKKLWRFTTFGRSPAITVTVSTSLSPGVVLDQVTTQAALLPKNGRVCSSTEDTVTGETLPGDPTDAPTPPATPAPSPSPTPSATPRP